jgi:dihydrofolate synthase/folylpolyglutamate synthase
VSGAGRGPSTAYRAALDFLFVRTTGAFKFGLERTQALLDHLGNPQTRIPCFHVAGTNGKGSTVATIAALLRARGLRVGTYTSPHLVDFRERIVVDGTPIDGDEVVSFIEHNLDAIERIGATFFEATTAMAFDHFARAGAEVTVIETGLGGRLDSTNVVDPLVAVVTSIGRDHTEYLGESLEGIAREKGGIFKRGRPAVIGEGNLDLQDVLVRCAHDAGASSIHVLRDAVAVTGVRVAPDGTHFRLTSDGRETDVTTPLVGLHQAANTALAWLTCSVAGDRYRIDLGDLAQAATGVSLHGRFERFGKYVFDVAHNPAGAEVLAETMRAARIPRPAVAVFSALRDKDWREMLTALAPVVDSFVLTTSPTAPASRVWTLDEAAAFAADRGLRATTVEPFDAALAAAARTGETVLVTGSFHTVGDAMMSLGVPVLPPARV